MSATRSFTGPVCAKCHNKMYVKKNGIQAVGCLSDGSPHEVTEGDLWCCSECDTQVITGWTNHSTYAHEEGFDAVLRTYEKTRINYTGVGSPPFDEDCDISHLLPGAKPEQITASAVEALMIGTLIQEITSIMPLYALHIEMETDRPVICRLSYLEVPEDKTGTDLTGLAPTLLRALHLLSKEVAANYVQNAAGTL